MGEKGRFFNKKNFHASTITSPAFAPRCTSYFLKEINVNSKEICSVRSSEPVEEDETAYNNLQRDLRIENEAMEAARVSKTTNLSDGDRDSDGGGNEAEDEHEDDDNSNEEKDQCEMNGVATKTLNHSAIDPFSEMESFIKSEPAEIEENSLDYEVTPEIKEELNSDSHSGNAFWFSIRN